MASVVPTDSTSSATMHTAMALWSLVHGIASLAIEGELRNVGIDQDPEDMVADALSDLFVR